MQKRFVMLAAVLVVSVALDQGTKLWAEAQLATRAHPLPLHISEDDGGKPLREVALARTGLPESVVDAALIPGRTTLLDPEFGGIRPGLDTPAFALHTTAEGQKIIRSYFWVFPQRRFDVSPRLIPYPRHLGSYSDLTLGDYLPVAFPSLSQDELAEVAANWTFLEVSTSVTPYEPVKPGVTYLIRDRRVSLWDGKLQLTYAENPGAAWGFLGQTHDVFRQWFFLLVSLLAVGVISSMFFRLRPDQRIPAWGFAAIIGGAIGNFIDRVRYNYVIDFIDFYVDDWHYPTFNIADVAITAGVVLLLLEVVIRRDDAFLAGSTGK